MARRNRVSVPNGTYHITSRIVNKEHLLRDPQFKDGIVEWLHGTAAFSGVELLAWCIMDNHFHVLVHVPEVPEDYWTDPEVAPEAYAFGMRPAECCVPIWPHPSPDVNDPDEGDSPHPRVPTRPELGFWLTDEEMIKRLRFLYGSEKCADAIRMEWREMRAHGDDRTVDELKARYCRRMYNVSQFAKTFKEQIARALKRGMGRVGPVFEGRFRSVLVQSDDAVRNFVALYIDYNPYKAKMVKDSETYRWSSLGRADWDGGAYGEACRVKVSPAQLLKLRVPAVSRGGFIARAASFVKEMSNLLPKGFPHVKERALQRLLRMVEWPPARAA